MTWLDELIKVRVLMRDPEGVIWSEDLLRGLYNDVQQDLQRRTGVLEDVIVQRVPPNYQCSYQFDWEWAFLPRDASKFYQCLNQFDNKTICFRWESQSFL